MFKEGIKHSTVVHQLWEIKTCVEPKMLDSVWDEETKGFFLREAGLEGLVLVGKGGEGFFQTFVVGKIFLGVFLGCGGN